MAVILPMSRLINEVLLFHSRFRRETLESKRGALHLILFDTSPRVGHTQQTSCLLRLLV